MPMNSANDSLSLFHPLVRAWFADRVGSPTPVQARAWPIIAEGRHVLLTAPTGSGKTLTAFLWSLQQLLTGEWPAGAVRVLYISPLKALNYDIERNLAGPLRELEARFREAGETLPEIRVMTRSGDTPSEDRQRMIRRPPEILITTPESLNILLTSKGGRKILGDLATVILDEVHAVAGSKRGTHLITAVDRLVLLSGEFQRIAISATIRPLEGIARWVAGYLRERGDAVGYRRRPMAIVRSSGAKEYDLQICARPKAEGGAKVLEQGRQPSADQELWPAMAAEFRRIIRANSSTLFFANSRRLTEKITRFINEGLERDLAYSHHGSLSREIRAVVERRLKDGELAALVATNSLELGIDIGELDEVVLVQTPPTMSSAVQRIGRAGHGVGQVSRGRLYPTHPRDFLEAAVVARGVLDQDIEEVQPVECPLDVLAQVIVSMVTAESWNLDELFAFLRTSFPYHKLHRRSFELVLEMLAGRYAESRLRDLKPRIAIDRVDGTVRGREGAARLIYLSGGTIPDRGYFALRLAETQAKLGELDEEFVWERSIGDTFALGAQSWRIERITHNDVFVSPSAGAASLAPFWKADERDRDFHLSQRLGEFLAVANPRLAQPSLVEEWMERHCMTAAAAQELLDLLRRQREITGASLPHRRHLLVEHFSDPSGGGTRPQLILHTFWGGRVNRPFSIALAEAWKQRFGFSPELIQDNDCINLVLPEEAPTEEVLRLVNATNLESLLRGGLEHTGFFGSRFRHNAARALLLPRANFRRRMPLWMSRLRSKKLLQAVSRYEDFPILMETWRACLNDEFDLPNLRRLLDELQRGEIVVSEVYTTVPSPFAEGLIWKQTNKLMYEDDTPEGAAASGLRQDLLKELVFSSHLRPKVDPSLVMTFEAKLQRTHEGYAPRPGPECLEWLKDRILLPWQEWSDLLAAMVRDHGDAASEAAQEVAPRAVTVTLPGALRAVCALEILPRLLAALGLSLEDVALGGVEWEDRPPSAEVLKALKTVVETHGSQRGKGVEAPDGESGTEEREELGMLEVLAEWLRFYGPLGRPRLARVFGIAEEKLRRILESLTADSRIVVDELTRGSSALEICDSENLEILLRLARARARPRFEPLAVERLPLFLAQHQGLTEPASGVEGLQERLERLFAYPAAAEAWEGEILPARLEAYFPSWLDGLLGSSDLKWLGCGQKRLTFAFEGDLELFSAAIPQEEGVATRGELQDLFADSRGRFSFEDLAASLSLAAPDLHHRLWHWAWQGRVTNDSFQVVRQGIESRFRPPKALRPALPSRRRGVSRWRRPRPSVGRWHRLESDFPSLDALDLEELNKDRVRLLLSRYGILFREILAQELPPFRWAQVFRTLRLMELSGEVLAGSFFRGIRGLQFMDHGAFRRLSAGLPQDAIYWMSAADPASLCGVDLPELKEFLPPRRRGRHMVFRGSRLVVDSAGNGRRLEIRVPADDPALLEYLGFLKTLVSREAHPLKSVEVREINGEPALGSEYAAPLIAGFGATREPSGLRLRKRYQ